MINITYKNDQVSNPHGLVSLDVRRIEYADDTPYQKEPNDLENISGFILMYEIMLQCIDNQDLEGFMTKVIELESKTDEGKCISLPVNDIILESPLIYHIVSLIPSEDINIKTHILNCINNLTAFNGKLMNVFFNANIVDLVLQEIIKSGNDAFLVTLFRILRNITSTNRNNPKKEIVSAVLDQIYSVITLQELFSIAKRSKIIYEEILPKFFYNITLIEPAAENYIIILNYLYDQYYDKNEETYRHNIWTLYQLTGYKSFNYELFLELKLHRFVDDMLSTDERKLIYPALSTMSNIFKQVEPDFGFQEKRIIEYCKSEDHLVRIAALDTYRRMISMSYKYVEEFTKEQKLYSFIECFDDCDFSLKFSIAQLVIAYFNNIDHNTIRNYIENHIMSFFNSIIILEDERLLYQFMIMMTHILEKMNESGGLAFFEVYLDEIDDDSMQILYNAQDSENKILSRTSTILFHLFEELPNRKFDNLLKTVEIPENVQSKYELHSDDEYSEEESSG